MTAPRAPAWTLLLLLGCTTSGGPAPVGPLAAVRRAVAAIAPTAGNRCRGVVRLSEGEQGLKLVLDLEGLSPGARHGLHVHEWGDATAPDGESAGAHYDPEGHGQHGLPDDERRHAGDLGNVEADPMGRVHLELLAPDLTLTGARNPVLGRSLVVHAGTDDGKTQPTGGAGPRIGLGVIGVAGN